jgi:hypothetical protein
MFVVLCTLAFLARELEAASDHITRSKKFQALERDREAMDEALAAFFDESLINESQSDLQERPSPKWSSSAHAYVGPTSHLLKHLGEFGDFEYRVHFSCVRSCEPLYFKAYNRVPAYNVQKHGLVAFNWIDPFSPVIFAGHADRVMKPTPYGGFLFQHYDGTASFCAGVERGEEPPWYKRGDVFQGQICKDENTKLTLKKYSLKYRCYVYGDSRTFHEVPESPYHEATISRTKNLGLKAFRWVNSGTPVTLSKGKFLLPNSFGGFLWLKNDDDAVYCTSQKKDTDGRRLTNSRSQIFGEMGKYYP